MNSSRQGYLYAILAITIFGIQDGISKHLGGLYPPIFITFMRYIAFGAFVLVISARAPGGIREAARTRRPVLQWFRGILLAVQIVVAIYCFTKVGLIQSQAIFAGAPIFVALLSMPILGEKVGWRRWLAILAGLCGVMILLDPVKVWNASGSTGWIALLPVLGAFLLASYGIATRLASQTDTSRTSFFYTGVPGVIVMALVGPFFWVSPDPEGWFWIGLLCITGMSSHFLLIKAYAILDAVAVQPISYLQLVAGAMIGVTVFGELLGLNLIIGSAIVVASGIFTVWREHIVNKRRRQALPAGAR